MDPEPIPAAGTTAERPPAEGRAPRRRYRRCRATHLWAWPELRLLPPGEPRDAALSEARLAAQLHPGYLVGFTAAILLVGAATGYVLSLLPGMASLRRSGGLAHTGTLLMVAAAVGFGVQPLLPLWLLFRRTGRAVIAQHARRHGVRLCAACGYLVGTVPEAFCPECGAIVPFPVAPTPQRDAPPSPPPSPLPRSPAPPA